MKALIVIPTYNEIENLQNLVQEIFNHVGENVHVLIVDDNSPDGTGELADVLAESNPRIRVLHRAQKQGLGTAYVAGFKQGLQRDFDVFIEMDSDFSHDPKYLHVFLKHIETCDVVIGSRYVQGGGVLNWGIGRRILSRGGSLYAKTVLGLRIQDLTGGYNCWRRSVIEAIQLDSVKSDGYAFQIEMKYKAWLKGFKMREVPIVFEDRHLGKSKMSKKIVMEAIYRVLMLRVKNDSLRQNLPFIKAS